jgi:hypothetical protein
VVVPRRLRGAEGEAVVSEDRTRKSVQEAIPEVMAKAFADGQEAARQGKSKYNSNPYGGLSYECGTANYPAMVPPHALGFSGWIRNEWFWGYEDIKTDPEMPEKEAYDDAVSTTSDALRATGQEFQDAYWQAAFCGAEYPEATTQEEETVYAAVQRVNETSDVLEQAQRREGML